MSSFCTNILAPKKYRPKIQVQKSCKFNFVQKNQLKNVGQIDSCILWSDSQFESKTPALKSPPQDRKLNQDEFLDIIQKY